MAQGDEIRAVAARFDINGRWRGASRLGNGHIHETWCSEFEQGGRIARFVHQCLNESVFEDVAGLMRNIERVVGHLRVKAQGATGAASRWEVPTLVASRDGAHWCRDEQGRAWRTFHRIERVRSFDTAPTPEVARAAARAFGRFVRELADFDPSQLVETIPRFHDLDGRLARLRGVAIVDPIGRRESVDVELERIFAREDVAHDFARLRQGGRLPVRVVHNDTKVNNALLDEDSGQEVAVVDLDTVMPGTMLFDFGDLVRTAANPVAEDAPHPGEAVVDPALFAALAEGFVGEVAGVATTVELDHLLLGARFMMLSLAVRFLTDYLEGDGYFRTTRPGQNLDRARVQLALLDSIEEAAPMFEEMVLAARAAARAARPG